ncbi:hypothetical protein [Cystobacter ferrugineus]|uniref:hypothetical protein n=1 Tax=Cystobacter ferrugineus TaxID=83449 RepID=UPI00116101CE|nr:hypothetical protein [Cystobacter ferrugineus]
MDEPADDSRVDPFLLGIAEISSATHDLADTSKAVPVDTELIAGLIEDVAKALHTRVHTLAVPSTPDAES